MQASVWLQAWEECRTGYPWIDAIMAQLHQWGWMHHLARHCVVCDRSHTLLLCTGKEQPLPKGGWLSISEGPAWQSQPRQCVFTALLPAECLITSSAQKPAMMGAACSGCMLPEELHRVVNDRQWLHARCEVAVAAEQAVWEKRAQA